MKKKLGDSLLWQIDYRVLDKNKVDVKTFNQYIPRYLYTAQEYNINFCTKMLINTIPRLLGTIFKIILNPRSGVVGTLDASEVDAVYSREAITYNKKHHLTTRGIDTIWRRQTSMAAISQAWRLEKEIDVLDICTGTGLTAKELVNLAEIFKVRLNVVGLDYNREMLKVAKASNPDISFVRADATNLVDNQDCNFSSFTLGQFDFAMQMFGIGGISDIQMVFSEILKVLKVCGRYSLIDMHKPIAKISGEWPIFTHWLNSPAFEMMCYERVTLPLALKRLWGWRDSTPAFYLAPLAVYQDDNNWYGFKRIGFEYNPQRWWLSLPIMPTAKILLEKEKISEKEARLRQVIASACKY